MTPSHIAEVVDYQGLQRAMRARAEALQISRETLTAISGMESGHVNKLLADPPSKNMGVLTFGLLLQGLALKLIVAEDPEQMAKLAHRMEQRDENNGAVRAIGLHPTIEIRISRRELRKRAVKGGKARVASMTKRQLSIANRKAARARWAGLRPKSDER